MEPNVNPLVPDSSDPALTPKPASPYSPSEPGAATPTQFGNSTFQSRTISPLEPVTPEPVPPQPEPVTPVNPVSPIVTLPVAPTPLAPPAAAFVGSDNTLPARDKVFTPQLPNEPLPKRKLSLRSKPIMGGLVVLLVGMGFAAYYFGYKHNPSVIYSQSMSNTAKGYDKLVNYINDQQGAKYNGTTGTGTFRLKSEGVSTDGNMTFMTDNKNAELTFDIGLIGTRLTFDGRYLATSSGSPDIYLKAGGIQGLGAMAGFPTLDSMLAKLDSNWILIDHTLIDSLGGMKEDANSVKPPTQAQIFDAAQAFGKVNKDYLFSSKEDKAVFTVVNKIGFEEVDGHSTYHYQVAIQKTNLKAYLDAQKSALKSSKLYDWLKSTGSETAALSAIDGLKSSVDSIKSGDKIDMWADVDQRVIYKVRFVDGKNAANNYVDVGLDYKGGDNFPFFIATQNKADDDKTNFKAVINLNTSTKVTSFKIDATSTGSTDVTFAFDVKIKPSSQPVSIKKPANAKPLAQVLSELGYGDLINQVKAANTTQTLEN